MSKERVCANTPVLSRRSALSGLAATCATGPAIASHGESEIMTLFRQQQELRDWIDEEARTGRCDDEALDPYCDKLREIEKQLMAIPAKTAADFAAKAIVDSSNGGLISCWETGDIWIEARNLTGIF